MWRLYGVNDYRPEISPLKLTLLGNRWFASCFAFGTCESLTHALPRSFALLLASIARLHFQLSPSLSLSLSMMRRRETVALLPPHDAFVQHRCSSTWLGM